MIACIRNLLFEYKKYCEKFMEINAPRDICKLLIDEQGITKDKLPESWQFCGAKAPKAEEAIDMDNCKNLIDTLILLANSLPLLKRMHEMNVECILPLIRLPKTPEYEDTNLRVEVMSVQLATADTAEEEPDSESDEEQKDGEAPKEPEDDMPKLEEQ